MATPPELLRFDAAVELKEVPGPFAPTGCIAHQSNQSMVAGGDFAGTTHAGPYSTLPEAYRRIFPRVVSLARGESLSNGEDQRRIQHESDRYLPASGGDVLIFVLELVELEVEPFFSEQLLVRSAFTQLAFVENEDAIRPLDRRQAVRDHDRGAAFDELFQRRADLLLGFSIDT